MKDGQLYFFSMFAFLRDRFGTRLSPFPQGQREVSTSFPVLSLMEREDRKMGRGREEERHRERGDQYQYLGNCASTPPLTQHVIIS